MATLLQKLQTDGSGLSLNGVTPSNIPSSDPLSQMHDTFSITGEPEILGAPTPSNLDLDNTDFSPYPVETFLPITLTTMVGPLDFSNVEATTDLAYTPGTFIAGLSFDNTETLGTFDLGEQ